MVLSRDRTSARADDYDSAPRQPRGGRTWLAHAGARRGTISAAPLPVLHQAHDNVVIGAFVARLGQPRVETYGACVIKHGDQSPLERCHAHGQTTPKGCRLVALGPRVGRARDRKMLALPSDGHGCQPQRLRRGHIRSGRRGTDRRGVQQSSPPATTRTTSICPGYQPTSVMPFAAN